VGLLLIRLVRRCVKEEDGVENGKRGREKDGKEAKSILYAKSLDEWLTTRMEW
jgi:hypothetical protein